MTNGLARRGLAIWRRRRQRAMPGVGPRQSFGNEPRTESDDAGERPDSRRDAPLRFELERVERSSEDAAATLLRVRGRWWCDEPVRVPSPCLVLPGELGVGGIEPLRGGDVELEAGPEGPSWEAAYPILDSFGQLPEELLGLELVTGQVVQLREPAAVKELRSAVAEEAEARVEAERRAAEEAQVRVELEQRALAAEQRALAAEQRALAAETGMVWLAHACGIELAEIKDQLAGQIVEAGQDTERAADGIERALALHQRAHEGRARLAAQDASALPAPGPSADAFDIEAAEMLALQLRFAGSSREETSAYLKAAFGIESADEIVARAFETSRDSRPTEASRRAGRPTGPASRA